MSPSSLARGRFPQGLAAPRHTQVATLPPREPYGPRGVATVDSVEGAPAVECAEAGAAGKRAMPKPPGKRGEARGLERIPGRETLARTLG
jgi:hypothetical protein